MNGSRLQSAPRATLAARLVFQRLRRVTSGRLRVNLPDGSTLAFGVGGGEPEARVEVRRWRFFGRLLRRGDVGVGEAFEAGDWDSPDVTAVIRFAIANAALLANPSPLGAVTAWWDRLVHLGRRNTRRGSQANIRAHYDLSNEFYALFLDPDMVYSCAYFQRPGQDLAAAQQAKLQRLAELARLGPGQRVLEIGCGWGAFSELAGRMGCRVTAVTLSEAQGRYARERIERAGLTGSVEVRNQDWRDLEGQFDAIVSIEMLEAVGHRYLGDFFAACDRLLAQDGLMALQTISIPDHRYEAYRRRPDWIQRTIFPGGHLPSLAAITAVLARCTSLVVDRLEDIGVHYAATLRAWRRAFLTNRERVAALGFDGRFLRRWRYYLEYCEAAFAERYLGDLQMLLTRPGNHRLPVPPGDAAGKGGGGC